MKQMNRVLIFLGVCFGILSFTMPASYRSQIFKTSLQVIVRNDLGNVEKDVSVKLYKTEEDYNKSENAVGEALKTDAKGKVLFEGLEPIAYFIQAEKGDKNNFGAGEKVPKLEANKINKVTIVISE